MTAVIDTSSTDVMLSLRWPSLLNIIIFVMSCLHLLTPMPVRFMNVARLVSTEVSNLSSSSAIFCWPHFPTDRYLHFNKVEVVMLTKLSLLTSGTTLASSHPSQVFL